MPTVLTDLQPYLAALSATLSVATLGFLLAVLRQIRENAQDRAGVYKDRLEGAKEDLERTEKWHLRERARLERELEGLKTQMNGLLQGEGLNLQSLALGRQLSDAATEHRRTIEHLVSEMKSRLQRLDEIVDASRPKAHRELRLSMAMGAMATAAFGDAASQLDSYAQTGGDSWEAHFSRAVAHANARRGRISDMASLRAYNDALALAPDDLDRNIRARLFSYRGAIWKRLGRLAEAEADLRIALELADADYEIVDTHYNLACVYAMRGDRGKMVLALGRLKDSASYRRAVRAHLGDYFREFATDPEVLAFVGGAPNIRLNSTTGPGAGPAWGLPAR